MPPPPAPHSIPPPSSSLASASARDDDNTAGGCDGRNDAPGDALLRSLPPAILATATGVTPPPPLRSLTISILATLWKGYGRVFEVAPTRGSGSDIGGGGGGGRGAGGGGGGDVPPPVGRSPPPASFVIKHVTPPPVAADAPPTVAGRAARKVSSFDVEAAFYTHLAPVVRAAGVAVPAAHAVFVDGVPANGRRRLAVASTAVAAAMTDGAAGGGGVVGIPSPPCPPGLSPSPPCGRQRSFTFVLSDLRSDGYPRHTPAMASLGHEQLVTALRWLARFHATWYGGGVGAAAAAAVSAAVAPIGGYWHLGWRQAELTQLPPYLDRLAAAAPAVADALYGPQLALSASRTLLHGDAKAANLAWSPDGCSAVAALDFQYVGWGRGVCDVANLLISSATPESLGGQLPLPPAAMAAAAGATTAAVAAASTPVVAGGDGSTVVSPVPPLGTPSVVADAGTRRAHVAATEASLLGAYTSALGEALAAGTPPPSVDAVSAAYELALVDVVRYRGTATSVGGRGSAYFGPNAGYALVRVAEVLDRLDGGEVASPGVYAANIERLYGHAL